MVNSRSNIYHNYLCKIIKIISADALPLILHEISSAIFLMKSKISMREIDPQDLMAKIFRFFQHSRNRSP